LDEICGDQRWEAEIKNEMKFYRPIVDGSEIPRPTTVWMVLKPLVNNGILSTNLNWCRISEPSTV